MKLKDLIEADEHSSKGTYAGVKYSPSSVELIEQFMETNHIPNAIVPSKIHTTLLYSRKFLPKYQPQGKLNPPLTATFEKFVVWKTTPPDPKQVPWNCLVMMLDCPELVQLHNMYMKEHHATYDYDQFNPHITLSYNIGDLDVKHLPQFKGTLSIVEEYSEILNLDWAGTDGVKK